MTLCNNLLYPEVLTANTVCVCTLITNYSVSTKRGISL